MKFDVIFQNEAGDFNTVSADGDCHEDAVLNAVEESPAMGAWGLYAIVPVYGE